MCTCVCVYVSPFQIVEMCLKYITHDPNYNYDDYDDDEGQMDMDEDDDGEEDDEYSDDDDMSWKVSVCMYASICMSVYVWGLVRPYSTWKGRWKGKIRLG